MLVVLGHTLREGVVRNIIYTFHVPCFFFLSGIVADHKLTDNKVCKEVRRTLIPYYTFGLISIAIYGILGSTAASDFGMSADSIGENLMKLVYGYSYLKFNAPLWFLPALFMTKILYKITYRWMKGNTSAIVMIAVIGSIAGFLYTNADFYTLPFSFELVLKLFPFFVAGGILAPNLLNAGKSDYKTQKYTIVGLLLLTIVCVLGGEYCPPINYNNNAIPIPCVFYFVAFIGCLGMTSLSMGLQSIEWLGALGKKSLEVMILHKFPVVFFQIIGPFRVYQQYPNSLNAFVMGAIPVSAIAIIMSLLAGYIIEKRFPFLLGISQSEHGDKKR